MSQFFPVNYQAKYALDYEQKSIKSKIKTQHYEREVFEDKDIVTINQYFDIFSKIYNRTFDITTITKLKVYLTQLQEQLRIQCNLEQPITIYQFLKNNYTASLQFRLNATFEYQSVFNQLQKFFVTESQLKDIKKCYKLTLHYRVDSLILNMSYHLMKFLQQFSDLNTDLIGLSKKFYQRNDINSDNSDSYVVMKDMTHYPQKHIDEGNIVQLFNDIYKPNVKCLSSSDMLKEVKLLHAEIQKLGSFVTIKQYIISKTQVSCDCCFKIKNLIINKSIENLQKYILNEQFLSDDVKNISMTYYRLCCEFLQIFCMFRTYLVKLNNLQQDKDLENTSVFDLLQKITRTKLEVDIIDNYNINLQPEYCNDITKEQSTQQNILQDIIPDPEYYTQQQQIQLNECCCQTEDILIESRHNQEFNLELRVNKLQHDVNIIKQQQTSILDILQLVLEQIKK